MPVHVLSAGALIAAVLMPAPSAEVVDFTAPPVEGLKLQVKEIARGTVRGEIDMGGETRKITRAITSDELFTHTVKTVKDGKARVIVRSYEDAKMGPQETPLSWQTIRATRGKEAGDVKMEMKDGDAWKPAPGVVRAFLMPRAAFEPILPVPDRKLKVGETWTFETKVLKAFFAPMRFGTPTAEISGEGRYTLREVKEIDKRKTALLDVKMTVEAASDEETIEFTLTGTAHYDLAARAIVGYKSKGKIETERGDIVLAGDLSVQYKAKITMPTPAR